MIYITQLIYINEGHEETFHQFEDRVIPIIAKYNGRLLLRIRPDEKCYVERHIEMPYELHLVSFESELDFENYRKDEVRKKFLHLKEQSIKSSTMIQGFKL